MARNSKPALEEDAEIEEENRHFGEVDGEFVKDLGDKEELNRS